MSRSVLNFCCRLAVGAGAALLAGPLLAQVKPLPVPPTVSPSELARLSPERALAKSRIAFFRELLEMNVLQRQRALKAYPEAKRAGLEAKIKEYSLLTPEARELRLRVTELQEYLLPLMNLPATNRTAQIAALPPELIPMVQVRLQHWDELSPKDQKELLENKPAVQRLIEFADTTPLQQNLVLTNMTPEQRQAFQQSLNHWQRLSDEQRQKITQRFEEYFSLTTPEKEKTLRTLSETERAQIEKTIRTFRQLDPQTRGRILEQFCRLSPSEFQQFFKNAERWQMLTPSARKAWRDLVSSASLLPPMPPTPGSRPPLPPVSRSTGVSGPVATNPQASKTAE